MKTTNLTFTQALDGYLLSVESVLSPNTIAEYTNTYRKFLDHLGQDPLLADITPRDLEAFLAAHNHLKKKTLLNYHVGLSSFWTWAVDRKVTDVHIPRQVTPPRPDKLAITPLSEQDVKLLLTATERTTPYSYGGTRIFSRKNPDAVRMRTTILIFLDTGLRVQEFCDLKVRDVDLRNKLITVFGKGRRQRAIPISARSAQAVWAWFNQDPDRPLNAPAFPAATGTKQRRDNVLHMFYRLGDRAGVQDVHPHRFRHTFAINFLRNGGDVYTLQSILGHATLDMVQRYLAIAQTDIQAAHRIASPVMNWGL